MPRNSGGVYSLPAGNPVVTGSAISSATQNNTMTDIATEMTNSLSRSNKGAMLAQLQLSDGTVGVPGLAFGSDTDMGFYYVSAGITRFSVAGAEVLEFAANKSKISGTAPAFQWNESDAAANNKLWNAIATGEEFKLQVLTDALAATDFMTVTRTAGVVDSIDLAATAVTINGVAIPTGSYLPLTGGTVTGATSFTNVSNAATFTSADALVWFVETGVTANNGRWSLRANGEDFLFTAWDDAQSALVNWLAVTRTAQTIDSITLAATTVAITGNETVSGTLGVTGNVAVNTNKFNVTAASGNTTVAGTLVVSLGTTLSTTLGVSGVTTLLSTLELGHASDTTIARIAAGRVSIEGLEIGYKHIPQNSQANSYTAVLADSGKHLYRASGSAAAQTWTIPSNASVAYDVGTVLTFVNLSANSVSIAINTDTMYLAGPGTTGTRTLAQHGIATAIKIDSTAWLISGTDLT